MARGKRSVANCMSGYMRDGLRRRGPLQHQRTFQPSNIRPLPLGGLSSIEGLRAPVAQLDRALPSEAEYFCQWR
jgi:hypothetical protein